MIGGTDQAKERVVVVRDGAFICAVSPGSELSSPAHRTALAASAPPLHSGFVVSAVASPRGGGGNCRLEPS